MGICDANPNKKIHQQEKIYDENIITDNELIYLLSYKSSICKIIYETLENGKIIKRFGFGFFCEINDKKIPFNKALFTNNHILNENRLKNNKNIVFESFGKKK